MTDHSSFAIETASMFTFVFIAQWVIDVYPEPFGIAMFVFYGVVWTVFVNEYVQTWDITPASIRSAAGAAVAGLFERVDDLRFAMRSDRRTIPCYRDIRDNRRTLQSMSRIDSTTLEMEDLE